MEPIIFIALIAICLTMYFGHLVWEAAQNDLPNLKKEASMVLVRHLALEFKIESERRKADSATEQVIKALADSTIVIRSRYRLLGRILHMHVFIQCIGVIGAISAALTYFFTIEHAVAIRSFWGFVTVCDWACVAFINFFPVYYYRALGKNDELFDRAWSSDERFCQQEQHRKHADAIVKKLLSDCVRNNV